MQDYIIIERSSGEDLKRVVMQFSKQGYVVSGGVSVVYTEFGYDKMKYIQAMIKPNNI